jgi:PAS domain S-box-containing protein
VPRTREESIHSGDFDAHFELALTGNVLADAGGTILRVNRTLCRWLGYRPEQLQGQTLAHLVPPDYRPRLDALLKLIGDGSVQEFPLETPLVQAGGATRWFCLSAASARAANGEGSRIVMALLDIEDCKVNEDILQRNQVVLSGELHAMESLHQLTVELQQIEDFEVALHHVLKAVATWNRTRSASLHLYREGDGALVMAAACGLEADLQARLHALDAGRTNTPHGLALALAVPVVVEDIKVDQRFGALAPLAAQLGYRAMHATPLLARNGRALGVLCTYWQAPHAESEPALRLMDLYARQIAHLVERRQAEESLSDSEARFRAMFDSTAVGMAQIENGSGRFLGVNDTLVAMTGYSREQLLRMDVVDLTHPDHVAVTVKGFEALLRGEIERYQVEKRVLRANGNVAWVQLTMNVVADADGQPMYTAAVLQDISERRHMEHALRASEQRFRTMADNVPVLIWVSDLNGRLEFVNQPYLQFFGLSQEQLRDFDWRGMLHPEDADQYRAQRADGVRRAGAWEAQARVRRADGAWRWIQSRANPILNSAGEVVVYVGSSTDLTDLLAAQAALIEGDRRKDQFLATLAHELRNPLAPLSASLASLAHQPGSGIDRAVLERMERQVTHMVRLVDDLMEVSRITRGTIELRRRSVEMGEVLRNAMDTSAPLIEAGRHPLEYRRCEQECWVEGDPVRLAQVFANLLNNAAKYSPAGARISVDLRHAGDQVEVSVRDEGVGLPADRLEDIFEMFTQVDGASDRSQGGLGIGLTLVRSLLELHGGQVRASSDGPGTGSCFTATLPVMPGEHGVREPAQTRYAVQALGRRILVVDDNVDAADSISEFLSLIGHRVSAVYDGAAAVAEAEAAAPELVLLDLGMPGMDGYETCRQLRLQPGGATMRIVALTGWGQSADLARTAASGFDFHLVKPVDLDALARLLSDEQLFARDADR